MPNAPRTTRRDFLNTLGTGAAAMSLGKLTQIEAASDARPNIVLIMADDMGYSDLGCYGSEVSTPNLDALAAHGLRFTQFYNAARCCPTRASLLTGLYPHQAGVGHMTDDKGFDAYRGDLSKHCVTIAEVLKAAGYATYMSGKWHVTKHTGPEGPDDNWPRQRGFDRYYGILSGATNYFRPEPPRGLTLNNTPVAPEGDDYYLTDAFTDYAIRFLKEHAGKPTQPFFLYLPYTCPHWPLHARPEDIAKYRGKYLKGWDATREERRRRMVRLGLIREEWALTPRDARAWEELDDAKKRELDLRMAIYAAQLDRMDQDIGRLVEGLRRAGQLDNTLIFFLADNGGCAEGGELGGGKPEDLESDRGWVLSYGRAWANASNTPFRRYKHWVHEGGISTPLIVHWPDRVKARGELRHQPGHLIDLMATCAEVAGAEYPAEHNGNAITPLEGRSLLPAFDNGQIEREAIYWEHEGNRAVRRGQWKLVLKHGEPWELFDLAADRTELHDRAAERPELVAELSQRWDVWAKKCGVQPWPVKGGRQKAGSTAKVFNLKQGDLLPKAEAPNVVGRGFAISARVDARGKDGVIVAQGGQRVGYSLYVKGGRLTMTVRRHGEEEGTTVVAPAAFPAGTVRVGAQLAKDGAIALTMDGTQVAEGKAPGPANDMPDEALSVGFDDRGNNGEYESPNEFGGKIDSVRIELTD